MRSSLQLSALSKHWKTRTLLWCIFFLGAQLTSSLDEKMAETLAHGWYMALCWRTHVFGDNCIVCQLLAVFRMTRAISKLHDLEDKHEESSLSTVEKLYHHFFTSVDRSWPWWAWFCQKAFACKTWHKHKEIIFRSGHFRETCRKREICRWVQRILI